MPGFFVVTDHWCGRERFHTCDLPHTRYNSRYSHEHHQYPLYRKVADRATKTTKPARAIFPREEAELLSRFPGIQDTYWTVCLTLARLYPSRTFT
jgi:hypothetical protein